MYRGKSFSRKIMGIVLGTFVSLVMAVSVKAAENESLQFSKDSGYYSQAFNLEINAQPGYTIYYTTDGSEPEPGDSSTKEYTGAINVASDDAGIHKNIFYW